MFDTPALKCDVVHADPGSVRHELIPDVWFFLLVFFFQNVLVLPHGLHLLCVVAHVALQSDALWCTLQHQVRGRGTWGGVEEGKGQHSDNTNTV